jgi:uncharacterized protein
LFIFDAHNHLGPHIPHYLSCRQPEDLISDMDESGISMALVQQRMGNISTIDELREGHDFLLESAKKYPKRIVPSTLVNPMIEESVAECEKRLKGGVFKGIKAWPMSDYPIDSEIMDPVMELCQRYRTPLRVHSDLEDPRSTPYAIGDLASRYPKVPVVIVHAPNEKVLSPLACVKVAKRNENIYLETTGWCPSSQIEAAIKQLGAERVIWGTDAPWSDFVIELAKVEVMHLTRNEKERYLGLNFAELIGVKPS